MQIIKNLSKPLVFIFHILTLVFIVLAVVFCFQRELFVGNAKIVNTFEIYTFKEVNFSLMGTYQFSNTFLDFSSKNTFLNDMAIFNESTCLAAKGIKAFILIMLILQILILIVQLFNFRVQGTFILSIIHFILFIIFIHYAKTNFEATQLIVDISRSCKTILVFFSLSIFFNLFSFTIKTLVKNTRR